MEAAIKLWITVALIALMTASAYPRDAKAQVMTGHELLARCMIAEGGATGGGKIKDAHYYGICRGFIEGAIAGLALGLSRFDKETDFCIPDVSVRDVRLVITEYIKQNPDIEDGLAVELIDMALTEKWNRESSEWPCQAMPSILELGE